jgi:uncharacterized protein
MRGWEYLMKHKVEFNILCTLHSGNAGHPLEIYRFFRDDLHAQHIQFIPIIERATQSTLEIANEGWSEKPGGERPLYVQEGNLVTERSLKADQYGNFLTEIFREWVRRDVGKVFVQMFDVTLASHFDIHSLCIHAPVCGSALAMEHNGDMYSCDHFVEPDYLLGNISSSSMSQLVASEAQKKFGEEKLETLPKYCIDCDVRYVCNGGCPKDRFISAPDGEPGLNYLCEGYKHFFGMTEHSVKLMAELIRVGRYADEIMGIYDKEEERMKTRFRNAERNELCPCGSGMKKKHCHTGSYPEVADFLAGISPAEIVSRNPA